MRMYSLNAHLENTVVSRLLPKQGAGTLFVSHVQIGLE